MTEPRQPALALGGLSLDEAKELLRREGPSVGVPEWARGGSPIQQGRAARGLHPMGPRLANNNQTCGSCAHCTPKRGNTRAYIKCALARDTNGPATDIRRKWPACEFWKERPCQS